MTFRSRTSARRLNTYSSVMEANDPLYLISTHNQLHGEDYTITVGRYDLQAASELSARRACAVTFPNFTQISIYNALVLVASCGSTKTCCTPSNSNGKRYTQPKKEPPPESRTTNEGLQVRMRENASTSGAGWCIIDDDEGRGRKEESSSSQERIMGGLHPN